MNPKILIIGACGQIGTELTQKLRKIYGTENVIASDIRKLNVDVVNSGPFEVINALDFNQIEHLVEMMRRRAARCGSTNPPERWKRLIGC